MYLVDSKIFKTFLDKNNLVGQIIPKPSAVPCIIEFISGSVIKAKVEVKNFNEFVDVVKFNRNVNVPVNKYWIRGDEWAVDGNGEKVRELNIE